MLKPLSILRVLLSMVLISGGLSACGGGGIAQTGELQPLRVSWGSWAGDYPLVLADQLGLFEKHGVKVELAYGEVYSTLVSQFAAGTIDTFNCQLGDALLLAERTDMKVVMVLDSSEGADAIITTDVISTPVGLKDKRFGVNVGSVMGELFVYQMLKPYGLSLADLVLVDIQPEDVPLMMGHKIDAGATWSPYTQRAVEAGNQVLFTSADVPGLFADVIPFRASLIEERPDDVRAFVAALIEAVDFWKDNPQRANAIISQYTGAPSEEITLSGIKIYNLLDNVRVFQPGQDTNSLYYSAQLTLDFMVSTNRLTRVPEIENLLDPSFLPKE